MNLPSPEDLVERRTNLSLQIARQRSELADAYRNLGKPIHYAENSLRSFGFLRKNTWIFVAVPAVFKIASILFGLRNKKSVKPAPRQRQSIEGRPKGVMGHALKWGGHGWRLFKVYRRVRRFFP